MFKVIIGINLRRFVKDFYETVDVDIGHSFGEQGLNIVLLFECKIDESVDQSSNWRIERFAGRYWPFAEEHQDMG